MRLGKKHIARYISFISGLVGIALFVIVVPSIFKLNGIYRTFEENVVQEGIEVDALFYTEEEATVNSEKEIKKSLSPSQPSTTD